MTPQPILSICIPTYNRIGRLLPTIKNILTSEDRRFVITVSDNCSTDGTTEILEEIDDVRLKVNRLSQNSIAYLNYNFVIQAAEADYVLLVLDKECFNVQYLTDFIDFLSKEKPNFGLVKISPPLPPCVFTFHKSGIDSVFNGGGGGDTHPSGFFYKKNIYVTEYEHIKDIIGEGGNLWILDLVSASLGIKYDSLVYNHPLISYDNQGVLGGRTKSSYTEKTIYWYGEKRVETFRLFIKVALSAKKDNIDEILYLMLRRHIKIITIYQTYYFSEEIRCSHYGLKTKEVGFAENLFWVYKLIDAFREECGKKVEIKYRMLLKNYLYGIKCSISACKIFIRRKIK